LRVFVSTRALGPPAQEEKSPTLIIACERRPTKIEMSVSIDWHQRLPVDELLLMSLVDENSPFETLLKVDAARESVGWWTSRVALPMTISLLGKKHLRVFTGVDENIMQGELAIFGLEKIESLRSCAGW
jgi:hypothetical protein